ncbi:MAG: type IV pilus biogenesis/stability protein PilW [Proteobacteria bacterium]|nr:type IV pilus biogenesis/stability protein PilW [Pseudomonadota bacterium]
MTRQAPAAALIVVMALLVLAVGCSRVTFVRPDVDRKGFERTAPEVDVRTDDRRSGANAARRLVARGGQLMAAGDLAAAEDAAKQAVKLAPDSAQAHTLLALLTDRRGDAASAGKHYLRAAELAPTQGGMLNNYGTWLCGQGRHMESLDWFGQALADRSYATPAVALANAGACAHRAGADERAARYLAASIEVDPTNPVALGVLAEREFRSGDPLRARAFSQRRLAAAPADAASLLLASQIEEKLGDKRAAARYVQQIRAEFPAAPVTETGEVGSDESVQ